MLFFWPHLGSFIFNRARTYMIFSYIFFALSFCISTKFHLDCSEFEGNRDSCHQLSSRTAVCFFVFAGGLTVAASLNIWFLNETNWFLELLSNIFFLVYGCLQYDDGRVDFYVAPTWEANLAIGRMFPELMLFICCSHYFWTHRSSYGSGLNVGVIANLLSFILFWIAAIGQIAAESDCATGCPNKCPYDVPLVNHNTIFYLCQILGFLPRTYAVVVVLRHLVLDRNEMVYVEPEPEPQPEPVKPKKKKGMGIVGTVLHGESSKNR